MTKNNKPHRYIGFSDLKGDIVLLKLCFSDLCVSENSFLAIWYVYVPMWFKKCHVLKKIIIPYSTIALFIRVYYKNT